MRASEELQTEVNRRREAIGLPATDNFVSITFHSGRIEIPLDAFLELSKKEQKRLARW